MGQWRGKNEKVIEPCLSYKKGERGGRRETVSHYFHNFVN